MKPAQLADVLEEIAEWSLTDRRAYIGNLEQTNPDDAKQIKDGLKKLWEERKA